MNAATIERQESQNKRFVKTVKKLDTLISTLKLLVEDDAAILGGSFLPFAKMRKLYPMGSHKRVGNVLIEVLENSNQSVKMLAENCSKRTQNIPIHAHDCDELIVVTRGDLYSLEWNGKKRARKRINKKLFVPAGTWHEIEVIGYSQYEVTLSR